MPRAFMAFVDAFWHCVDDFRSVVSHTLPDPFPNLWIQDQLWLRPCLSWCSFWVAVSPLALACICQHRTLAANVFVQSSRVAMAHCRCGWRNIQYTGLARLLLHSFRTLVCSPSGPGAMSGWIVCNFFRTVSSANVTSATHSLVLWWNSWMVDLSSCTNTDLKKSPNTFAFSW